MNSSMNSRGNGRPILNRFVLDKSHLRMRHDMWVFNIFRELAFCTKFLPSINDG